MWPSACGLVIGELAECEVGDAKESECDRNGGGQAGSDLHESKRLPGKSLRFSAVDEAGAASRRGAERNRRKRGANAEIELATGGGSRDITPNGAGDDCDGN